MQRYSTSPLAHMPLPAMRCSEHILQQGSGECNEDALLMQDSTFGVFDGASSLNKTLHAGKSGAWWAAMETKEAFAASFAPLPERAKHANKAIAQRMEQFGVAQEDRLNLWSTSAAVVEMHEDRFEYAQIGDCLIICIRDDGSFFMPVRHYNHDVHTLSKWKQCALNDVADIPAAMHTTICDVRMQMNKEYGVLNGEPEAMAFIKHGTVSLDGVQKVLLFTDGLHLPSKTPSISSDFTPLVELYKKRGLQGTCDTIRALEAQDSECRLYPRFKQHDDVAALVLSL